MNYEVVDIILRLGAAAAAGVIIGINRDLTNKPIGMRTLGLVSLGAAVVSLRRSNSRIWQLILTHLAASCRASSKASWPG